MERIRARAYVFEKELTCRVFLYVRLRVDDLVHSAANMTAAPFHGTWGIILLATTCT